MHRALVLFAREPVREAREKGFGSSEAADLFGAFAKGWLDAAASAGATLIIASPPEDRCGWRRRLVGRPGVAWISQRGRTFGERLEGCARSAARLADHVVLVGGDVAPDGRCLREAFEAVEDGADAALAPAPDGGVSLLGLHSDDLDLLGTMRWRRRNVFVSLQACLSERRRRIALVSELPDVDGLRGVRLLLRQRSFPTDLASLARRLLTASSFAPGPAPSPMVTLSLVGFAGPRAPPRAA